MKVIDTPQTPNSETQTLNGQAPSDRMAERVINYLNVMVKSKARIPTPETRSLEPKA